MLQYSTTVLLVNKFKTLVRTGIFLLIVCAVMSACDCVQQVTGSVIDSKTGKPVSGITVANANKSYRFTTTDSMGYFELSAISGGYRCPPMQIIVAGNGYQVKRLRIEAGGHAVIKVEANTNTK